MEPEEFVSTVIASSFSSVGEALAGRPPSDQGNGGKQRMKLVPVLPKYPGNRCGFQTKPCGPVERGLAVIVETLINQIVTKRPKRIRVLFNCEQALPPGIQEPKREAATAREQVYKGVGGRKAVDLQVYFSVV